MYSAQCIFWVFWWFFSDTNMKEEGIYILMNIRTILYKNQHLFKMYAAAAHHQACNLAMHEIFRYLVDEVHNNIN